MDTTTLEQWNTSLSKKFTVSTILQCCYLVVGVLGNLLVISMYKFKMRGQNEDRFFIPVLAVVDLAGCLTSASLSLTRNLFPVMFPSEVICKLLFFSTSLTIISSLLLLLVISVQRYQKICRPFGWQMTESHKYCFVAMTVCCAGLLSIPVIVLYGKHPIQRANITGVQCGVGTGKHGDLAIYNYIILTLECIAVGIMTYLYFLVGKRVFYSFKSMKSYRRNFSISKNSNAAVHCPSEDESFISKESADICTDRNEEKLKENQPVTENSSDLKKENNSQELIHILVCNASTQTMPRRTAKKSLSIDTQCRRDHNDRELLDNTDCSAEDAPVFICDSVDLPSEKGELDSVQENGVDVKQLLKKNIDNSCTEKAENQDAVTKKIRSQSVVSLTNKRNQSVPCFGKQRNQSISSFSKSRNRSAPSLNKNKNQSVASFSKDRKASNVDSIYSNKNTCTAHRYTIMFIVISFVAIVTYIPPWIFIIMETRDHDFWSELTYSESVTFIIIRRIYIINHVINPVIYGLFDGRFRYTLKKMLCPKVDITL
ncbi:uncharacterized protein LOC133193349 [Saccostrea echinata]|uniref:uncharacterized protein LOC133193349 n=1 Tax=Saccostrea echinata TaxID=191078 RepID=UPI002A7F2676|nr:uncharacterized protein LOC133193349 [Saccostrea echinata]